MNEDAAISKEMYGDRMISTKSDKKNRKSSSVSPEKYCDTNNDDKPGAVSGVSVNKKDRSSLSRGNSKEGSPNKSVVKEKQLETVTGNSDSKTKDSSNPFDDEHDGIETVESGTKTSEKM